MMIKINILKDKIAVILLMLFIGFTVFDLFSGTSFLVNIFYFIPLSILFLIYLFLIYYDEKVLKIIILILFFIILYLYFQSSLNVFTCRSYSDYHCLAKKSIKNKNILLCEKYTGRKSTEKEYKQYCFEEISKSWHDISLCNKISDELYSSKYRCIVNIAINNNDKDLCEKIDFVPAGNTPNKKSCYEKLEIKP